MTAQKGRDLLLKLDSSGTGTYTTVAGLRASSIAVNAESIDITHQESTGQWRELLAGAGVRSATIRGQGIFKDAAADATIRQYAFAGTIRNWQIVLPDFGIVTGPFQIVSLEYAGRHDAEVTFDIALASAGELVFAVL